MASGVAIEVATFGGYTFALGFHEAAGLALMTTGCTQAMYHAKDLSMPSRSPKIQPTASWDMYEGVRDFSIDAHGNLIYMSKDKKHTPGQEALSDLVKEKGKKGVTNAEADTLLDWAEEYDFPRRDDRGKPIHWEGGEHIHLGPKHVKVYD